MKNSSELAYAQAWAENVVGKQPKEPRVYVYAYDEHSRTRDVNKEPLVEISYVHKYLVNQRHDVITRVFQQLSEELAAKGHKLHEVYIKTEIKTPEE